MAYLTIYTPQRTYQFSGVTDLRDGDYYTEIRFKYISEKTGKQCQATFPKLQILGWSHNVEQEPLPEVPF